MTDDPTPPALDTPGFDVETYPIRASYPDPCPTCGFGAVAMVATEDFYDHGADRVVCSVCGYDDTYVNWKSQVSGN